MMSEKAATAETQKQPSGMPRIKCSISFFRITVSELEKKKGSTT